MGIPTHLPTCIDGGARRLRFCSAFHQKVNSLIKQQRESPGWKRRRETEPCCWRKGASQSWCWSEGSAATGLVLCVCLLVSSAAAAALFILIVLLLGCFFCRFLFFAILLPFHFSSVAWLGLFNAGCANQTLAGCWICTAQCQTGLHAVVQVGERKWGSRRSGGNQSGTEEGRRRKEEEEEEEEEEEGEEAKKAKKKKKKKREKS